LGSFGAPQWIAGIYLGVGGGAFAFILWVMALAEALRKSNARAADVTEQL
jgi:hypothetical protein